MAQGSRKPKTVFNQRWERFKVQLQKFKGSITASLIFTIAFHVAKIVVGSMYLEKCPINRKIPIFLIVAGVVGIFSKALTLSRNILLKYFKVAPIVSFLGTLELAWFICGCVWVFGVTPSYEPTSGDLYCNKTAYLFAFVYVCVVLAILVLTIGLCLFFLLCICCCAGILSALTPDEEEEVERRPPQ